MDVLTGFSLMCKMRGANTNSINRRIHIAYQREWKKHFGSTDFSAVIHYNGYEAYITSLFEESPCGRTIWVHNDMAEEIPAQKETRISIFFEKLIRNMTISLL